MALMDIEKREGFAFWRKASARPSAPAQPLLERAIKAFSRAGGDKRGFDGREISGGDHISLMKKHPKLFG